MDASFKLGSGFLKVYLKKCGSEAGYMKSNGGTESSTEQPIRYSIDGGVMNDVHPLLKPFLDPGDKNIENMTFPKVFVERMLETNGRAALEKGHRDEREEIVCRLIANGMSTDEVSLILKIRVDEIRDIAKYNGNRIADYAKKLKARRKSRERAAFYEKG